MKKKRKYAAMIALGTVGALSIIGSIATSTVYAASDTTRPNSTAHEAIKSAIEANDYEAFVKASEAISRPEDAPEITEATFAKLVEAHKLHEAGDHEGAQAIMESIGFTGPHHGGRGVPMANLTDEQKAAMEEARALFKEGKKDEAQAVLDAAGIKRPESRLPENLTDEQKAAFEEAEELMEAGKMNEARTLLNSVGIKRPEPGPKN